MATKKSTKVTTAQLVARYNRTAATLGKKPVKKFADRKTAERRLKEIEAQTRKQSEPREGTRRALLLKTRRKVGKTGVGFQNLHKTCGFKNEKSTRDAMYLLGRKNGYTVVDRSGRLHLDLTTSLQRK